MMRPIAAAFSYALLLGVVVACALFGQPAISPEVARRPSTFQVDRAMEDLRRLDALSASAGGRRSGSIGNGVVSAYVGKRMQEAGLEVYQQKFQDRFGGAMRNVIGVLPGAREETILIGAHHDVLNNGPAVVEGLAGLATMIELARASSRSAAAARAGGLEPSRTLVFASWDGESFGCAGASHFVDTLPDRELQDIRAMVSLDAIGWSKGRTVVHTLPYEDRFGELSIAPDWLVTRASNAARARNASLSVGDPWLGPVYQVLVRKVDLGYYSDDRPFLAKGVPAVLISNFSLSHAYPHTGTAQDTLAQVGREQIDSVGRSVEAILTDLGTAPALPVGEQQYLVLEPPFSRAFRLTLDQIKVLALLALLPGAFILIGRPRASRLTLAGLLFIVFSALFVAGTFADPLLFPPLFVPALLSCPLLAVRRPGAMLGHLVSHIPVFLLASLLIPVYVTGSSRFVKLGGSELALLASLTVVGVVQALMHHARVRRAVRERARPKVGGARLAPLPGGPSVPPVDAVPRGAPGAS